MQKINFKNNIDLKCYIVQNNKILEFSNQKERAQYLKEKMHTSNGIIRSSKTPYEIGITEFGNIIDGKYIKQNIKIIKPPKIYFVTMNKRRYYGATLKHLADVIDVNYISLIHWFNGKEPIGNKFNITEIGYIQGDKTIYLDFETSGTQYYLVIGNETYIYNNLVDMSKRLGTTPTYISKLLCGVRSTDKCSEIGYYIDGKFIKSEKQLSSEYKKYTKNNTEKIKEKNKKSYIKENSRMLNELMKINIKEFMNIPLYKKERDLMAAKLNIKNNKGVAIKWTKLKKLMIESGLYEFEYKAQVVNKERKDYVIIRIKKEQCISAPNQT